MRGKKEGRKRLLAMVLAGALLASGLPAGVQKAQAAETEPVTITTEKDVYVQGGSDKDKVMNGSNIVVKTPESASLESTYHRRGLIEFDLTEAPEDCNTAVLKLQVAALGKQYTGTDRMDVYTTETGWDASAMTWNNMPERTSEEAVAYAYKADIDGNQGEGDFMCIDISDAVTEALAKGETAISLELEFPVPQGGDHALYFSRTEKAVGALVLNVYLHFGAYGVRLLRVVEGRHGKHHVDGKHAAECKGKEFFQAELHLSVFFQEYFLYLRHIVVKVAGSEDDKYLEVVALYIRQHVFLVYHRFLHSGGEVVVNQLRRHARDRLFAGWIYVA